MHTPFRVYVTLNLTRQNGGANVDKKYKCKMLREGSGKVKRRGATVWEKVQKLGKRVRGWGGVG